MNSNILQSIGLGNLDIAYLFLILLVFIVVLFVIIILQMKKLNRLQKRLSKFMTGKDAKSLEKDIVGLYEDNKFLKINVDKNKKDIRTLYKNMEHAFQKIGLIKYDAFQQMGGKLSFSLAMLDVRNNGFIINLIESTVRRDVTPTLRK